MKRRRICDCAVEVLRETGNGAVMWGDEGLLSLVAERAGMPHEAWKTSDKVLNALSRCPGDLVPGKTYLGASRRVARIFWLPEEFEKREREVTWRLAGR